MASAISIRWSAAFAFATLSAVVGVTAFVLILSPVFNESTDSCVRVALTGVTPVLAILAVTSAADASSKVLKTPWNAALLGMAGCASTAIAYEIWYASVDATEGSQSLGALPLAAGASVVLNGSAVAALILPALRRADLPMGVVILIGVIVAACGGTLVLLIFFPVATAVLVSLAALITVVLLRRSEGRRAISPTATPAN